MGQWEPVDYIVAVLSVSIAVILIESVTITILTDRVLTPAKTEILSGIVGSVVSVISVYVGACLRNRGERAEK